MGWAVLYFAFAVVALWLLGEVLLQYKARLRWRLLAFAGFLGVVLGVLMASVFVIVLGALAFAAGQTLVTLSFRRGFAAGWALKGKAGEKLGALGERVRGERERGPSLEVSDLRDEGDEEAAPAREAGETPEAATTAVFDAVNVAEGRGVLSEPATAEAETSWQTPVADHSPGYQSGYDPYTAHGYAAEAAPAGWDQQQPVYGTGTYDPGAGAAGYGTGAYDAGAGAGAYGTGAGAYDTGTGTYDTASFAHASPFGGALPQQPQDPSGTWAGLVQGDATGTWGTTTDGWGQQYAPQQPYAAPQAPQEQYPQPYADPYAAPYGDPYATGGYGYPVQEAAPQETPPGGVWVPRQRGEEQQDGAWPAGSYEGSEGYGYRG
ncbi:hypothetical protein ACQYWQ_06490 [Streptomyces sp. P6-2-1]|uniref:hypothetical protein n=1 Tax=unclassified Streptomyces TaxID=2593676 RepID=UPI003D363768